MTTAKNQQAPVQSIRLRDGRRMAYREYGAPEGRPVLAFHGTPGSAIMYSIAGDAAKQLGLRLIAVDRWGYAGTGPHPQPAFAAWPADVEQLAEHLGLKNYAVIGISGGCPYAAAVAAHCPERVNALALVVPVGLIGEPHVAGQLNVFHKLLFLQLPRHPGLMRTLVGLYRKLVLRNPERTIRASALTQAPSDRRVLQSTAIRSYLGEMFRDGLAPGIAGVTTDLELFSKPWNVLLSAIRCATRIWIGTDDRLVPLSASRALAAAIPRAAVSTLAGKGHFWIMTEYEEVLRWIAAPSEPA